MIEKLFEKEKNMFYKLNDLGSFLFQTFRMRKLSYILDFFTTYISFTAKILRFCYVRHQKQKIKNINHCKINYICDFKIYKKSFSLKYNI